MSPLLVYPDLPPPELAQSLDLAGFSWKAVANSLIADEQSIDHKWQGQLLLLMRIQMMLLLLPDL